MPKITASCDFNPLKTAESSKNRRFWRKFFDDFFQNHLLLSKKIENRHSTSL